MKIDIRVQKNVLLKSEEILKFFITENLEINRLIISTPRDINLVTTDFNVYEALASVKQYDNFNHNKLKKLLEVVDVHSFKSEKKQPKPLLKEERVEELRKIVLRGKL